MNMIDLDMLDITAPNHVEIEIKDDGKVVWINVDGICRCRLCRIGNLQVEDRRNNNVPD